ncbi:hypothetical protein Tco_0500248 [Tanacetum coccineum]
MRLRYETRGQLAYEQESMETRQALARSEAYNRELEARVTVLETQSVPMSGSVRMRMTRQRMRHYHAYSGFGRLENAMDTLRDTA